MKRHVPRDRIPKLIKKSKSRAIVEKKAQLLVSERK